MDLAGDPVAPPQTAPEPIPAQQLVVTPDNVVQLAVLFNRCADLLTDQALHGRQDLRLEKPWLDDHVSEWAWERFNQYFVDGEHSFAEILRGSYDQHAEMARALNAAAAQYGRSDEVTAELMRYRTPR